MQRNSATVIYDLNTMKGSVESYLKKDSTAIQNSLVPSLFFYSKPRNQVKSHNIKIVQFTCIKALLIGSALSKNADTIFSSEIIYMCMSTQLVPPTCYATCAKLGINILLASMFFFGCVRYLWYPTLSSVRVR